MIQRVVTKRDLHDPAAHLADLRYWLSRPPAERLAAVELLRRQRHGDPGRIRKVVRIMVRRRRQSP